MFRVKRTCSGYATVGAAGWFLFSSSREPRLASAVLAFKDVANWSNCWRDPEVQL